MPDHHAHTRRRSALACGVVAVAAIAVLALQSRGAGSAAKASPPSPYAEYPALDSTAPSGLTLVIRQARGAAVASGPTFPIELPDGLGAASDWPIASSIRRVSIGVAGISAWIARSTAGGVCVLAWDGRPKSGIAFGCSAVDKIDLGAAVELPDLPALPGRVLTVGVAPARASAVTTTMADGTTDTVPVTDNAWAHLTAAGRGNVASTTIAGD